MWSQETSDRGNRRPLKRKTKVPELEKKGGEGGRERGGGTFEKEGQHA